VGRVVLKTLLLLQIICCAVMTGLIWTVQVLHYPTFKYISEIQFQKFHRFHTKNMTIIVLPVMVLEFFTSSMLVYLLPDSHLLWINFFGLLLIWMSTFLVSVPLHNLLQKERNSKIIERLILTNWPRTILWTLRLGLLFCLLWKNREV
jgi:uncharacterized membrane protein YfcA